MQRRYSASANVILRDGAPLWYLGRNLDGLTNTSEAERDALTRRIVNLLNADQHAASPQQWLGGDGSTELEKQASNWRETMKSLTDLTGIGSSAVEIRCVDPPARASSPAAPRVTERSEISRDTLEEMCHQHHVKRTLQGFTTLPWAHLEERNREQYRQAMKSALWALGITVR
jgi:hypothetical protein